MNIANSEWHLGNFTDVNYDDDTMTSALIVNSFLMFLMQLHNFVTVIPSSALVSDTQTPWAALLSPSTLSGETNAIHLLAARAALSQIRVETLIGSQANYEITIQITIHVYNIMISYEKYSALNLN